MGRRRRSLISLLVGLLTSTPLATAQADLASKRGLAFHGDRHGADNRLLLSDNSSIAWYYTWSPYTARGISAPVTFVPLVHGLLDAQNPNLATTLGRLPSRSTHLLAFNEPDGTTESGGSAISPQDAARAYINQIVPLRSGSRRWKISHPVVTGSGNGLDWLRRFNDSCFAIDRANGCPADFVAVHWYGNFVGLAGWLGTLHDFYGRGAASLSAAASRMWITEMALPQQGAEATLGMMNESLAYLDGLDYVEAYAWFGAFRTDEANAWTGDGVSLFDHNGGLTELGALYLGGEQRGFTVGMTGGTNRISTFAWTLALSAVVTVLNLR